MKPIKMFGLAALAALMAMALVGASSAMAELTTLCSEDNNKCTPITHVHEESVGHAKLLSSFATVECEALFLGDTLNSGEGNPLIIHGTFAYSCLNGCTAEEENGPAEIKVLKEGTELATVTGEGLVHVVCGLNCRYNGVGLKGHALGALKAANGKGEVTISGATVNKESGTFCPSTSKLDITTEPLTATYIKQGTALLMACIKVAANTGLYKADAGNGVCTNMTGTNTRDGEYELAKVKSTLAVGEMACGVVRPGLLLGTNATRTICSGNDTPNRLGVFELGTISSVE
jgi:hypothetical protein